MSRILVISPLNSLTFKIVDDNLPSYDNTLSEDWFYEGKVSSPVLQRFRNDEDITIQFQSNQTAHTVTLINQETGVESSVSFTQVSTYTDFSFYEFTLSSLANACYKVKVTGNDGGDDIVYFSETFQTVDEDDLTGYIRIDYWNEDKFSLVNAYVDYSTGIKHKFWIRAKVSNPVPGGSVDVYDNLGNLEKIREVIQRVYPFQSEETPIHLALKFWEATALDNFYVNDIQYVTEDKPEPEELGNRDTITVTADLTQSNISGVNSTQDVSVTDPTQNTMIKNPSIEDAAGNVTIAVTAGYGLRWIKLFRKTGTVVTVTCGITPSGSEIFSETLDDSTPQLDITVPKIFQEDIGGTLYFSITGAGATVSIYTWQEQYKTV